MRDRRTCLLWLAAALAGCSPTAPQPPGVLDISGADYGRDFRLRDPSGAWRKLADFRGKAVMVFFGFALCPDVCPTALFKAAESLQALGGDAAKVQVLFISLDPDRYTPEILNDNYVMPQDNQRLPGAQDIELPPVGHIAMLYDRRVARLIIELLNPNQP